MSKITHKNGGAKTPKTSKKKSKLSKSYRQQDTYLVPQNLSFLSKQLISWAEKPDSFHFIHFRRVYGIPEKSFYVFVERNEEFAQAFQIAQSLMQARLLDKLIEKVDSKTLHILMMGNEKFKDNLRTYNNVENSPAEELQKTLKDVLRDLSRENRVSNE
jgi:hypothetical protein